jgi:hypothetical protein
MNRIVALVAPGGMALDASSCQQKQTSQQARPFKQGDNICIGPNFYVVGDMQTYPWVLMTPYAKCQEHENTPSTIMNVEKIDAYQPDCVCRYSAKFRKKCSRELDAEACLAACKDRGE